MNQIIKANQNSKFLSDVISKLPSKCLFNKGITGCGGTTLEIEAKRDSIILVPNINLVLNKCYVYPNLIGVYGETSKIEFSNKLDKHSFNKIIATYDALPKLIDWIGNTIYDYFLLIDEYHILFNSYSFRYIPISFILQNYQKFHDYCFMTATPLADYNILEEIKNLPQIEVEWEAAIPVNVTLKNTYFTSKELVEIINSTKNDDFNWHIFINSINTIRSVINKMEVTDYRTICSKEAASKDKNKNTGKLKVQSINSKVCKVNFYTATAFEGVDIYDPKGKTIVISDTNIAQSLVDISTLFIQICGRLRDSIYKNEVIFICNTNNHRYLKYKTDEEFKIGSNEIERKAKIFEQDYDVMKIESQEITKSSWESNPVFYQSIYLGKNNTKVFYDPNLKKIDKQNFDVITKVFCNTINILNNLNSQSNVIAKSETPNYKLYKEFFDLLPSIQVDAMDISILFGKFFKIHKIASSKAKSDFLAFCSDKRRVERNGKRFIVYDFTKLKTIIN